MNLQEYKTLLLVVTALAALLVASPALQRLLVYPQTEFFSEFWLLGPQQTAENFPFNLTSGTDYNVFLGVGNQLGNCAYYLIEVKFHNQTQPTADRLNGTSSSMPSLYNITAIVADKEKLDLPAVFSFSYVYSENPLNSTLSRVDFRTLTYNGLTVNLEGYSATWDPQREGFFGNLLFELWIYNSTVGSFQYHERFANLWLNMTI